MQSAILIATAFATSALSGVLGMGGGMLMLGVMAAYFQPALLIPLHGIVQLAANGFRSALSLRHVEWRIVRVFACGAAIGAFIGSRILIELPQSALKILMGVLILLLTWLPPIKSGWRMPGRFFLVAMVSSFLALFVGATGPLLPPVFLRENFHKEKHLSTQAACQFCVHLAKLVTFFAAGFRIGPMLGLASGLVGAVLVGAVVAKHLLARVPDRWFRVSVKVTVSALAARLLFQAFQ